MLHVRASALAAPTVAVGRQILALLIRGLGATRCAWITNLLKRLPGLRQTIVKAVCEYTKKLAKSIFLSSLSHLHPNHASFGQAPCDTPPAPPAYSKPSLRRLSSLGIFAGSFAHLFLGAGVNSTEAPTISLFDSASESSDSESSSGSSLPGDTGAACGFDNDDCEVSKFSEFDDDESCGGLSWPSDVCEFGDEEEVVVKTISYKEKTFTIEGMLGEGSFGRVMLAVDELGDDYALKVSHKASLFWVGKVKDNLAAAKNENRILRRLTLDTESPFVTQLLYAFEDDTNFYMVMHLYPLTLGRLIMEDHELSAYTIRLYAAELISAIETLHRLNILHRDIKPDNILIGSNGHLALADFNCARAFPPDMPAKKCVAFDWAGTRGYQAPEIFGTNRRTDWKSDVWAFGVILLEMFVRSDRSYFDGLTDDDPYGEHAVTTKPIDFGEDVPDVAARDLLRKVLERNPKKRLTVAQVKAHPFFWNIDWESLNNYEYPSVYRPGTDTIRIRDCTLDFSSWHAAHYSYEDYEDPEHLLDITINGFDFECPAELRRNPSALPAEGSSWNVASSSLPARPHSYYGDAEESASRSEEDTDIFGNSTASVAGCSDAVDTTEAARPYKLANMAQGQLSFLCPEGVAA